MWKTIWERIQSPVVLAQLVSILAGAIVLLAPEVEPTVKIVVGAVVSILNMFAGLNNPADKINF